MSKAMLALSRKLLRARILLERGELTEQDAWDYALQELPQEFRRVGVGV